MKNIREFVDPDGFSVPVYTFYLTNDNKPNQNLEQFYNTMRVNNQNGDKGGLLDLSKNSSLVANLCEYTMRMIADKNPDAGDAEGLRQAAMNVEKGLSHV